MFEGVDVFVEKIKKEIVISPLDECVSLLSAKEIEGIYKGLLEIDDDPPRKFNKKDKLEYVFCGLMATYNTFLFMVDADLLDDIRDVIENNVSNDMLLLLINEHILFEKGDKYYLPAEFKEIFDIATSKGFDSNKTDVLIDYYVTINGAIKISKLIELVKESGFVITRKDALKLAKEGEFIIDKDMVYYNEFARYMVKEGLLVNEIDDEYKIVNFPTALEESLYLRDIFDIDDTLEKLIVLPNDEEKRMDIIGDICSLILSGYDIDQRGLDYILDKYGIDISEENRDNLFEFLCETSHLTPSWKLNGYSAHELFCDEEDDEEDFNDEIFDTFSDMEKAGLYISDYVLINGIISVNKLLEILTKEHNLGITKRDVINLVKNNPVVGNMPIIKDYACYTKFSNKEISLIMALKKRDSYMIIDSPTEFSLSQNDNFMEFETLCNKYGLNDACKSDLFYALRLGTLNMEFIKQMLTENCNILLPVMIDNLYKDFMDLMNNTRMWSLNGFTPIELGKSINV